MEKLTAHFDITHSKRSCIAAGVVTALLLAAVIAFADSFLSQAFSLRVLLFIGCLVAPFLIGALIAFRITLRAPVPRGCAETVLLFLLPVVTVTMTEALNGVFVYDMTYIGFGINYLLVLLLMALVFAVSGSFKLSVLIVNPPLYLLALISHYLVLYRGTPLLPVDVTTIGVADTILNEYSYLPDYQIITATLVFVFLMVVGARLQTPRFPKPARVLSRTVCGVAVAVFLAVFYGTSAFADAGLAPDFWNQTRGYRNYGVVYGFFGNTKYLYVQEPDGYDPDDIEGLVGHIEDAEEDTQQPDIICIMNESLSDLSVLGNLQTNAPCLPFISSLRENTVRGNLYVPVIGAGTANTEFEFLTGHSMAFLPSGSSAYMLYVKDEQPSLAKLLAAQGYSVRAQHPYYARGWNRTTVYPLLGLSPFASLETLFDMTPFTAYQQSGDLATLEATMEELYPGENVLIRQYVSDAYNYKLLIEDYEQRDTEKPYFMFNVTMQNHGGYRADADNFGQNNWLTDTDEFPQTDRYLSLMKYSDDAFKDLIAYFETVDRPVLICLFGDHQPAIESAFSEELLGTSLDALSLEQQQARHITPFLIWANFDIEEKEIDMLSSNYLSSLLLQTAGVRMSAYDRYLLRLSETLPVVDTVGYIDSDGNYYGWSDASPYKELLSEYRRVQYNCLFDIENRKEQLFTIQ